MNETAFRELVERFQHKVFRLVCGVLGPYSDAEAEDITQEVFLQVLRKSHQFRGESDIGSWLYTIARRRALDRRKQARFRLPHTTVDPQLPLPDDLSSDQRLAIAQSLEALPELYRTLIYLFYWQGATVDEIAELTGLPAGTVKSYLARARQQLERLLPHHGAQHAR